MFISGILVVYRWFDYSFNNILNKIGKLSKELVHIPKYVLFFHFFIFQAGWYARDLPHKLLMINSISTISLLSTWCYRSLWILASNTLWSYFWCPAFSKHLRHHWFILFCVCLFSVDHHNLLLLSFFPVCRVHVQTTNGSHIATCCLKWTYIGLNDFMNMNLYTSLRIHWLNVFLEYIS